MLCVYLADFIDMFLGVTDYFGDYIGVPLYQEISKQELGMEAKTKSTAVEELLSIVLIEY